jgi:hypothetical protein
VAGRRCTICIHPRREEIDSALSCGDRTGAVSARFGVSADALHRHAARHVLASGPAPAESSARADAPPDVLTTMLRTQTKLLRVIDRAERSQQGSVFVAAARELRQTVEAIARLTGSVRADGSLATVERYGNATGTDAVRGRILAKLLAIGARPPAA